MVNGLPARWGVYSRTVILDRPALALACWKDTVVVSTSNNITILDVITGSPVAVLSDHTDLVRSIAFSQDGASLVSGSDDNTIKLWDMQTGGVVRTFHGHLNWVMSVSISPDHKVIASGSLDKTICLWNIGTGECYHIIEQSAKVICIDFSPLDPQHFIFISQDEKKQTIQQWNIVGHQIGPVHEGSCALFSSDGVCFIAQGRKVATVNPDSGITVAKYFSPNDDICFLSFSPDGRLLAGASYHIIYIWDITSPDPHPIETFVGHNHIIQSLKFSSSLTLLSCSRSIRFWQIDALSKDLVAADSLPIPPTLSPIKSIVLQGNDGVVISINSAGVVKTWDISTGCCNASFCTPVIQNCISRDVQMIDGWLILVWFAENNICIWDIKKGELIQKVDVQFDCWFAYLRISGDGSKVFLLGNNTIQAWSITTGETVGEVKLGGMPVSRLLCANDSKVWVYFEDSSIQEWDFGISGSSPILLSDVAPDKPHFSFIHNPRQVTSPSRIEDTVTGQEIFQLSGRYAKPSCVRWDGRYLAAGYISGEVLILDFNHILL